MNSDLLWALSWAMICAVMRGDHVVESAPIVRWALDRHASRLASQARGKGAKLHQKADA